MGPKLNSWRLHADPLRFPVQAHVHRKAGGFLLSGSICVRWGPMEINWALMWAHVDHLTFPVQPHMHRKAWGILASELIWIQCGPMGTQCGFM